MAKRNELKRTITKSGEVRYYRGGKRIKAKNGQRAWVRKNIQSEPQQFTPSELRSYNALKRYQESWKFDGVQVQIVYVELLKKMAIPVNRAVNKDLATIKDAAGKPIFKNFVDILRMIDAKAKVDKKFLRFVTQVGLPNYRNRSVETFSDNKVKNIVDFVELLDTPAFKNYTLSVIDPQGDEHRGRVKGVMALRDFEIEIGEQIQAIAKNSAFMRFSYDYSINPKEREIQIDLTDINEMQDLQDFIDSGDAKKGDTISISGKFKDVDIEVSFS